MTREEFRTLITEVASVLGQLRHETWTVTAENPPEYGYPGAELTGGIARLGISYGWHAAGKVTVAGKFPDGYGHKTFAANVDPARGAAAIAKEANRRVIAAGYVDELLVVLERKARHDQEQSERMAWLAEAAALFGRPAPEPGGKLDLGDFVAGSGRAGAYWTGSDRMNIDLSGIPAETALRMLSVLAKDAAGRRS